MSILDRLNKLPLNKSELTTYKSLWTNGDYTQLADKLLFDQHFELAAQIYEQAFDFQKAFHAYKNGQLWKQLCEVTVTSNDTQLHHMLVQELLSAQKAQEALTWLPKTAYELRAVILEEIQNYK